MADFEKQTLTAQLNADPRVQQYMASRWPRGTRGAMEIPADLLRQWGYAVPDGYGVATQGRGVAVYDKHDTWDTILPLAAAGVGGYAALSGGLAPAASAAQQGPELASRTIPNMHAAVPNTSEMVSQGVSQSMRPGGFLPTNGGNTPSGASDAASFTDWFKDPSNLAGMGSLVAALASGSGGGGDSAEARQFQEMTNQRMRRVDPLHQAVTQLAWGRLPISARQGVKPPEFP